MLICGGVDVGELWMHLDLHPSALNSSESRVSRKFSLERPENHLRSQTFGVLLEFLRI